ncbi:MAG: hypothetical protein Kow0037_32480 [Calditrichia bacterium]
MDQPREAACFKKKVKRKKEEAESRGLGAWSMEQGAETGKQRSRKQLNSHKARHEHKVDFL